METIMPALPEGRGTLSTSNVTPRSLKWPELKWQQVLAAERTQELAHHNERETDRTASTNQCVLNKQKKQNRQIWLSDAQKKVAEAESA